MSRVAPRPQRPNTYRREERRTRDAPERPSMSRSDVGSSWRHGARRARSRFGASIQNFLVMLRSGLGGLLPGGDRFRIYSITGTYPKIKDTDYRLTVTGLVQHPKTFTLDDLKAMPVTSFTKTFQCVTGWKVPDVHWEGSSSRTSWTRWACDPGRRAHLRVV